MNTFSLYQGIRSKISEYMRITCCVDRINDFRPRGCRGRLVQNSFFTSHLISLLPTFNLWPLMICIDSQTTGYPQRLKHGRLVSGAERQWCALHKHAKCIYLETRQNYIVSLCQGYCQAVGWITERSLPSPWHLLPSHLRFRVLWGFWPMARWAQRWVHPNPFFLLLLFLSAKPVSTCPGKPIVPWLLLLKLFILF